MEIRGKEYTDRKEAGEAFLYACMGLGLGKLDEARPVGSVHGFTLTAFCTGCVFGIFLRRRQTAAHIAAAVLIQQLLLSLLADSLWISILYQSPYVPLLHARVMQCMVLGPVQFAGSGLVVRALSQYGKKAFA